MKRKHAFRYTELAALLRDQIFTGKVKPGEFLLSENELSHTYQLSRSSVRRALDELLREGLIVKKAGQGTIVSPHLTFDQEPRRVLRIMAVSPSHFVDTALPAMIDEFERLHPHVTVKLLHFPAERFWESVESSSAMGLQPDLLFISDRQFHQTHPDARFVDLAPLLQEYRDQLYPRLIDAFTYEQRLLAAPLTFSTVYLAYNPEMFAREGVALPHDKWSYADFVQAAESLTKDNNADGITDQYGLALSSSLSRWPVIALQNRVNSRTKVSLEVLEQSLAMMHDWLYRRRVATLYHPNQHRINSDAFRLGQAGMVLTTAIELAGWHRAGIDFEPGVASLPFGPRHATLLVANAMMMPEQANDPQLATLFLRHLYREEGQHVSAKQNRFLSIYPAINSDVWGHSFLKSLNIVGKQIKSAHLLHEWFGDRAWLESSDSNFELFWAGLEQAHVQAASLQKLLR